MRIAHRHHHVHGGHAAVALLDFRRVISIALNQVSLKRNALVLCNLFDHAYKFAVGQRAGIVQKDCWSGAQQLLCFFRMHARSVAGDAALNRDADLRLYQVGRRMSTAKGASGTTGSPGAIPRAATSAAFFAPTSRKTDSRG